MEWESRVPRFACSPRTFVLMLLDFVDLGEAFTSNPDQYVVGRGVVS